MLIEPGTVASPALFDVLHDRVAACQYPSPRWVASAAVSARTVEQCDRLIETLGRRLRHRHLLPRDLSVLAMVVQRRVALAAAEQLNDADRSPARRDLARVAALLNQTTDVLS